MAEKRARDGDEVGTQEAFERLLDASDVQHLLEKKKPLVSLKASLSLGHALEMLAEHDILGAPVMDDKEHFRGFVDVLDICAFTLHELHVDGDRLHSPQFAEDHFFHQRVERVVNYSHRDDAVIIAPNANMHDVVALFNRSRVHRLAVGKSLNAITGIVTQSDVIAFLARHLAAMPQASSSLSDLKLVRPVVSVMLDARVSDALETLHRNRVSGLALLDPDGGRVAGNLSASDLRLLSRKSFQDFDRSVLSWLSKTSGLTPPRTVPEETNLAEVVKILAEEKIHRVYITRGESDAIRGVVSLSDIIRLVHPKHKESKK